VVEKSSEKVKNQFAKNLNDVRLKTCR